MIQHHQKVSKHHSRPKKWRYFFLNASDFELRPKQYISEWVLSRFHFKKLAKFLNTEKILSRCLTFETKIIKVVFTNITNNEKVTLIFVTMLINFSNRIPTNGSISILRQPGPTTLQKWFWHSMFQKDHKTMN